jgi:uncharacterized membrane protein
MPRIIRAAVIAAVTALSGVVAVVPAAEAKRKCHPSYKGACLKRSASDYDCAGGSGDGPYYVHRAARIVGPDPFDLDSDGDGWGCE